MLPFSAQAGLDSHSDEIAGWLLGAFLVVVVGVVVLFCAAFQTRLLVWPPFSTIKGKIAVFLLVVCFAVVCGAVGLFSMFMKN
ncbi:hypothetical protein ACFST9_00300 [Hymenobacter monticola]